MHAPNLTEPSGTNDNRRREVVLLIHGTFANSRDDNGEAWWQFGSHFWNDINLKLEPFGKSCVRVFHWSGLNSERARRHAAFMLLTQLRQYELEGTTYHLIGHSHGGSVIWNSLLQAESVNRYSDLFGLQQQHARPPLTHLRHLGSWSTIGTPFMFYRPSSILKHLMILIGFVALWWVPLLFAMVFGVRLLTFVEVWFYLCSAIGVLLILFGVPLHWLFERRSSQLAMTRFGNRWLGIWSREDEAIFGLRQSLQLGRDSSTRKAVQEEPAASLKELGERILSRFTVLDPTVFTTQVVVTMIRVLLAPVIELFELLIIIPLSWIGKVVMWSRIRETLQGTDLPLRVCYDVQPSPIAGCGCPVESELDAELIDSANHNAVALIPKFRRYWGQAALQPAGISKLLGGIKGDFTGAELVHNSYYNHPDVRDLLVTHIAHQTTPVAHPAMQPSRQKLRDWYDEFRHSVSAQIALTESRNQES